MSRLMYELVTIPPLSCIPDRHQGEPGNGLRNRWMRSAVTLRT